MRESRPTTIKTGGDITGHRTAKIALLGAASLSALAGAALAEGLITIPAKSLAAALDDYIHQSGVQLIYNADDVAGLSNRPVRGATADEALGQMLAGTGLTVTRDGSGAIV